MKPAHKNILKLTCFLTFVALLWFPIYKFTVWLHAPSADSTKISQNFCAKESQNECGVIPKGVDLFPWIVKVIATKKDGSYGECGGSLISNQYVITAQHCLIDDYAFLQVGFNGHWHEAEVAAIAPNHDAEFVRRSDMAILRLKTIPVGCITPICLPSTSTNNLKMNDNLTMASFYGDYHEKSIHVIDGEACYEKYVLHFEALNLTRCEDKFKAEATGEKIVLPVLPVAESEELDLEFNFLCSGKTTIKGESGSPLMRKDKNNIWSLIAIVRGVVTLDHCDSSNTLFAVDHYQTLSPLLSWVNETITR